MSNFPPERTRDTADDNATARDVRDDADGAGPAAAGADDGDAVDHDMNEQQAVMMSNLTEMRKKTLKMGTELLISKFGSGTDCASIVNEIREYIELAKVGSTETYLAKAESSYSQVETLLETLVPKSNIHGAGTSANSRVEFKSSIVSHKVTVKGDEHDVSRCIIRAKAAIDSNQLDDAERLLLKAERIHPSNQARELLQMLKHKKEAVNHQEHQSGSSQIASGEDNSYVNRDNCLDRAKIAIAEKDFETAQSLLKKAQKMDPLFDIKPMLDLCEDAINERKMKINICLELAKEALAENNFEQALKLCQKVRSIDQNYNIRELFSLAQVGLLKSYFEKVKKCIIKKQFNKALVTLQELNSFSSGNITKTDLWVIVHKAIEEQEHLKSSALKAIEERDFSMAKEIIFNISRKYPEIEVEDLWVRVEAGIASTSSTSHIFKCIDDLKKTSDECIQIIQEAIDRKDIAIAEDILNKVKASYSSMNIEELCCKLESLKMTQICDVEETEPEPSTANDTGHKADTEANRLASASFNKTSQETKASLKVGIKKGVSTSKIASDQENTKENDLENKLLKGDCILIPASTKNVEKELKEVKTTKKVVVTKIYHRSQASSSSSHFKERGNDTSDHVCSELEHKLKKYQRLSRRKDKLL